MKGLQRQTNKTQCASCMSRIRASRAAGDAPKGYKAPFPRSLSFAQTFLPGTRRGFGSGQKRREMRGREEEGKKMENSLRPGHGGHAEQ